MADHKITSRLESSQYLCHHMLFGFDIEINGASLQYDKELDVDIYGEAMLRSPDGKVSQVAFGFDYFYQKDIADLVIDSSNLTLEQTVEKILDFIGKR